MADIESKDISESDLNLHLEQIELQSEAIKVQLEEIKNELSRIDITAGINDSEICLRLNEKKTMLMDRLARTSKIAKSIKLRVKAKKILEATSSMRKKLSSYDVNGDGVVDAEDALQLLKEAEGMDI